MLLPFLTIKQLSLGSKRGGTGSPFLPPPIDKTPDPWWEGPSSDPTGSLSVSKRRISKPWPSALWPHPAMCWALWHRSILSIIIPKPETGRLIFPEMLSGEGTVKGDFCYQCQRKCNPHNPLSFCCVPWPLIHDTCVFHPISASKTRYRNPMCL